MAPSNAEDRVVLESQLGEQLENDGGAPCRMPSVSVEDIEDEDAPARPILRASSPRRPPSVTLEEVPDQDLPHPPRWGPHPFAKPTRPSLFPRPHPDPMAADLDVFKEAYWLDNIPILRGAEEEYFRLPRNLDWHWKNVSKLDKEILHLPCGPRWFQEMKIVEGDQGVEVLDLWKWDICDMVQWSLSN
ncbi:hypothetical protein FRC06_001160 [Ceratobasidium sp. 370]|nr:hypothetical protein FRC06_001160 [Ceratobasidium sp. 370]